jgi:hypothetical protein
MDCESQEVGMIEMKIKDLAFDIGKNGATVLLADLKEERTLPIWIGLFEAKAIALELQQVRPHRPMTHDLISNIFKEFHATITRIVITDLRENVYYALILARNTQGQIAIDSRPSDAIAVALRVNAPIFVENRVMARAGGYEREDEEDERTKKFMEWVDKL